MACDLIVTTADGEVKVLQLNDTVTSQNLHTTHAYDVITKGLSSDQKSELSSFLKTLKLDSKIARLLKKQNERILTWQNIVDIASTFNIDLDQRSLDLLALAELTLGFLPQITVTFSDNLVSENSLRINGTVLGANITINANSLTSFISTLNHELTHLLTHDAILKNAELQKLIIDFCLQISPIVDEYYNENRGDKDIEHMRNQFFAYLNNKTGRTVSLGNKASELLAYLTLANDLYLKFYKEGAFVGIENKLSEILGRKVLLGSTGKTNTTIALDLTTGYGSSILTNARKVARTLSYGDAAEVHAGSDVCVIYSEMFGDVEFTICKTIGAFDFYNNFMTRLPRDYDYLRFSEWFKHNGSKYDITTEAAYTMSKLTIFMGSIDNPYNAGRTDANSPFFVINSKEDLKEILKMLKSKNVLDYLDIDKVRFRIEGSDQIYTESVVVEERQEAPLLYDSATSRRYQADEIDDEIPFDISNALVPIERSDMLARLTPEKNSKKYTTESILAAFDFLNHVKEEGIAKFYYRRDTQVTAPKLKDLKIGDIIGLRSVQWFKLETLEALDLEQFPPQNYDGSDHGCFYSLDSVMRAIEEIDEKSRTKALQEFLNDVDNKKYRYYDKNVMVLNTFYKPGEGWLATVAYEIAGEKKNMYLNLGNVNVQYIRKLDTSFKSYYEYDSDGKIRIHNGKPVYKKNYSDKYIDNMPLADFELAESIANEIKNQGYGYIEGKDFILFENKKGNDVLMASYTGNRISIDGWDLVQQAEYLAAGDVVRYKKKWENKTPIMSLAVIIGQLPGGVFALDIESGEKVIINTETITGIFFNKDNAYFDQKQIDDLARYNENAVSTGKNSQFKGKFQQKKNKEWTKLSEIDNNPAYTKFPYWSSEVSNMDLNKNIKRGDVVLLNVYFEQDKKWQVIYAPVFAATNTHIYYVTKDGKVNSINTDYGRNGKKDYKGYKGEGGKWVKIQENGKETWQFKVEKDGKYSDPKSHESYVEQVYHYNPDYDMVSYVNNFKDDLEYQFEKGHRMRKNNNYLSLDDAIDSTLGATGEVKWLSQGDGVEIVDGKVVVDARNTSISANWDVKYIKANEFHESNAMDYACNLVKGDIVKIRYEKDGKTYEYWAPFSGYNYETGQVKVAYHQKDGKKAINSTIEWTDILAVGRRMTPLVVAVDASGKKTFFNTSDVNEVLERTGKDKQPLYRDARLVSPGRPELLDTARKRIKEFITLDRKVQYFDSKKDAEERIKKAENYLGLFRSYKIKQEKEGDNKGQWYFEVTTENGKTFKLRHYQLMKGYIPAYGVGKYSFDQANKASQIGDVATFEIDTDEGKVYYTGVITNKSDSYIEINIFEYGKDKKGNKDYGTVKPIPIRWYKSYDGIRMTELMTKTSATVLLNIAKNTTETEGEATAKPVTNRSSRRNTKSNSKSEAKPISSRRRRGSDSKPETETKAEETKPLARNISTRRRKSKETTWKSHDSREAIITVSSKLSEMYGVETQVLTLAEFDELGIALNVDVSDARAFVMDGKIFINSDKASTADVLHELTHLLLPGLKALNPKAYEIIMGKIRQHPEYQRIHEKYQELSGHDLDEEVFCNIFGEYFRRKMPEYTAWDTSQFDVLTESVPEVVRTLFDVKLNNETGFELMNMTIEEIMNGFGSSMIRGLYTKSYKASATLGINSRMQKLYSKLIDSGTLTKIC